MPDYGFQSVLVFKVPIFDSILRARTVRHLQDTGRFDIRSLAGSDTEIYVLDIADRDVSKASSIAFAGVDRMGFGILRKSDFHRWQSFRTEMIPIMESFLKGQFGPTVLQDFLLRVESHAFVYLSSSECIRWPLSKLTSKGVPAPGTSEPDQLQVRSLYGHVAIPGSEGASAVVNFESEHNHYGSIVGRFGLIYSVDYQQGSLADLIGHSVLPIEEKLPELMSRLQQSESPY